MMRFTMPALIAVLLPSVAQAEDPTLSFGVTFATEYVSSGLRYSDGPVAQPYVELGFGGAYAGFYTSNVEPELTSASIETGVYVGYGGSAGKVSYDVALYYYLYRDAYPDTPVNDSAEWIASLTYSPSDALSATVEVAGAPEYDQTKVEVGLDYYPAVDGLSVSAKYGRAESNYGDWDYWSIGTDYAVSDHVSIGLTYHGANVDPDLGLADADGLVVGSVTLSF